MCSKIKDLALPLYHTACIPSRFDAPSRPLTLLHFQTCGILASVVAAMIAILSSFAIGELQHAVLDDRGSGVGEVLCDVFSFLESFSATTL